MMFEAGQKRHRTTLRLPSELAERVEEAAAIEGMAINTWVGTALLFTLEHGGLWEEWRERQRRRGRRARLAQRER